MVSEPLAEEELSVRSACERLSVLSRKFEFGNLEFKVKGSTAKYPLEAVFMEELLISLALAETYLKGLIHLNTLGVARVNRLIGVLEMVLGESTQSPNGISDES